MNLKSKPINVFIIWALVFYSILTAHLSAKPIFVGPILFHHSLKHKSNKMVRFQVRIAKTEAERKRGFMYQNHIADNEGILFIFKKAKQHCFWMKNTPVSLDIHLLNDKNEILESIYDMKPYSRAPRCFQKKGVHILEIKAKNIKLKNGGKVILYNRLH